MPDFNIDDLKNTWQKQPVESKYESNDILAMLNKNSRNYIKYILWISIAEFLLIIGITLYYLSTGTEANHLLSILTKSGVTITPIIQENLNTFYTVMKVLSIVITMYFVIKFYQNYRQINIDAGLKKFIIQIISFKKTVNQFIFANILLLVSSMLTLGFMIYTIFSRQNIRMESSELAGFIVGATVALLISVGLMWLYYRLVYGILTRKLGRNLRQLQEIEANEDLD